MQHNGHTTTIEKTEWGTITREERPMDCEACVVEKKAREKIALQYLKESKENSRELVCDECNAHMGYVDEFDLNETKFYCDSCKESN